MKWNVQRSESQRWGRRLVMADTKKTANAKPVAKAAAAKATDTNTASVTTAPAASVAKTEPAAEPKKAATAKKTTTRKTAAKKTTTKKETAKKTTAAAKKTAVKETVHVQFADKSYTAEDLVKIAKDVWKYDLNQKVSDFKSVELYVKPEESVVYYVINGEVQGNFGI